MKSSRITEEVIETFKNHGNCEELFFTENYFSDLIDFSSEVYSEKKLFHLLNSDPATSNIQKIEQNLIETVDFSEEIYSEAIFFQLLNSDPAKPGESNDKDITNGGF